MFREKDIDMLSDDCLILIFEYLPLEDKFKIKSVCRRWRCLSKRIFSQYKIIIMQKNILQRSSKLKNAIDLKNCMKILIRNPNYIKTVDFSVVTKNFKVPAMKMRHIIQWCTNIKELYLTYAFPYSIKNVAKHLKPLCINLKKFGLHFRSGILTVEEIFNFLKAMTNLEHLYIQSPRNVEFLSYVRNDKLEELIIDEGCPIYMQSFCNIFQNATKLHTISMCRMSIKDEFKLPTNSPIRNLALMSPLEVEVTNWLNLIPQLINIEQLCLTEICSISDEFLSRLVTNCKKITFLNIDGCSSVSDDGIAYLKFIPHLRHLSLSHVHLTGQTLGTLPSLEVLDLLDCPSITDEGIETVLQGSPRLAILNLYSCFNITDRSVFAAIASTRTRQNHVQLNMGIGRTQVTIPGMLREFSLWINFYYRINCISKNFIHYISSFPTIKDFYDFSIFERIQV